MPKRLRRGSIYFVFQIIGRINKNSRILDELKMGGVAPNNPSEIGISFLNESCIKVSPMGFLKDFSLSFKAYLASIRNGEVVRELFNSFYPTFRFILK